MRRLFIPILLFLCGACTNTIDYDFSQVKPELMVIGWLDQSASSQTVCVSLSEGGLVKPVDEATVTCYVNGERIASVSANAVEEQRVSDLHTMFINVDPLFYQQLPVSFSASLKPGDKVQLTIEANHGAYKASSCELIVPKPVEITQVDTARITVQHLDWNERYLQIRADVPDRKGEDNWYCITIREMAVGTYTFKDGGPDISVSVCSTLYIKDLDDPILLDGNMGPTDDLNLFDYSGNGAFACFSDQLFRDGTAHLRMNTYPSWNDEGPDFTRLGAQLLDIYGYDMLLERGFDKCRADHWLEIHLSHCSQDAYHYLRSLRTISSEGYNPEIVEPVTVPSNFIGGIGLVDVINTAISRIDLPSKEVIFENDY